MKSAFRRALFCLLSAAAFAAGAPFIEFQKYLTMGAQTLFRGYTYLYVLYPQWKTTPNCFAAGNNCNDPQYVPDGTEVFIASEGTTAGGIQSTTYAYAPPRYKAVNIGTNGNPAGYYNLVRMNQGGFVETSFLANPGTSATAVTNC